MGERAELVLTQAIRTSTTNAQISACARKCGKSCLGEVVPCYGQLRDLSKYRPSRMWTGPQSGVSSRIMEIM